MKPTTRVTSQPVPTEIHAQSRAPRSTAPPIANASAMNGGPGWEMESTRSTQDAAVTSATTGPGKRRAASSSSGPMTDSAAAISTDGECCL